MFFEPKRVEKPWGYEIWFAQTDTYVGKLIHINEGNRLSLQYHVVKDETIYCVRGAVSITYEKDDSLTEGPLEPGRSFRIQAGAEHRLTAGNGGCDLIEVSTPQTEDVVRVEDDYGRAS